MRTYADPHDLAGRSGEPLGSSAWRPVDQRMVQTFADVTGDHQWIHTDPGRAAAGPFGAPVAHGFLVASLLPAMLDEVVRVDRSRLVLNKGVERLRFAAPVPVGSHIRARVVLECARARPRQFVEAVFAVTVEVREPAADACDARLVYLYQAAAAAA